MFDINVNAKDSTNQSVLHHAVLNCSKETVELLLNRGARESLGEKDNDGNTPLHYAAEKGYTAIAKLLVIADTAITKLLMKEDAEAVFIMRNNKGDTPGMIAERAGHSEIAALLAEIQKELYDDMQKQPEEGTSSVLSIRGKTR